LNPKFANGFAACTARTSGSGHYGAKSARFGLDSLSRE
jgi:hypothetical protein